jgi:hypothetical protein
MDAPLQSTHWTIDGADVITSIGTDWDTFAAANGGASLSGSQVVGRSLFDFITGDDTQQIYRLLLHRVRALDAPIIVPFRCDSPDTRRYMRLEIRPMRQRGIEFHSVGLRVDARRHLRLVDASEPRLPTRLISCSFCLHVQICEEQWLEAEDAVVRLGLLAREKLPQLVPGVCPACNASLRGRLNELDGSTATSS